MRRGLRAPAACAVVALSIAAVVSSSAASRHAPRVALPTGVAGRVVWVNTPRGFTRGRLGSPLLIVDKDPNTCPTPPGAQNIAVCFTRLRSVVPDRAEMYRVASSLGGAIEPSMLQTCGPLVQHGKPPVRPASCAGESLIDGYNVAVAISSVVRMTGSQMTAGLTQPAPSLPRRHPDPRVRGRQEALGHRPARGGRVSLAL